MRLTQTRREALNVLVDGGQITVGYGIELRSKNGRFKCRLLRPTLDTLISAGVVERVERKRQPGSYAFEEVYEITDLGRAAIGIQKAPEDNVPA